LPPYPDVRFGGFRIPVISDIVDAGVSLFKGIPGSEWITDAVSNGADWVGDMAKTTGGQIILAGITNAMLFPGIANLAIPSASGMQFVGPQVASLVWAIPGMAAGDSFADSYAKEVTWRTVYITQIFGLGQEGKAIAQKFLDGIAKVLNVDNKGDAATAKALDDFGAIYTDVTDDEARKRLIEKGLDYGSIARRDGVRYDSAAAAVNARLRRKLYDIQSFPVNGGPPADSPETSTLTKFQSPGQHLIELASSQNLLDNSGLQFRTSHRTLSPLFMTSPKAGDHTLIGNLAILAIMTSPVWMMAIGLRWKKR
jgi:hypothetical protein